MGEIKSVKVDNWGVFFLQKLQNFFNKTDYCDLTLQFNDNSQLKVHRLVLSACTDYFNVLEQTCEVIDDALLMPNELQADVVVPIVNFMYTGTLEFELKMYGKLLRTAKEMNMTVLLKLLEAHRRTMEGVNRAQRPTSPKNVRKRGAATATASNSLIRPLTNSPQERRILASANVTPQRRQVQTKTIATNVNQPQMQQYHQQVASTSILKSSATSTSPLKLQRSLYETSTHAGEVITYESAMQFKQEQHDEYETQLNTINQSTSPFEQLRKGYNNNKRPASATFISPPAKKPNIEDVKEFSEQQRMRKQIAAEFGEDQEYEGTMLDDDIHNDDDDDEAAQAVASSSTATAITKSRQHQQGPSIIIKQEPNEKPTIVVKDSSNSKMNHAKIISEVLRQYPHLVKSNKNIKLKIMPNVGGQSQKIIVKKEQIDNISAEMIAQSSSIANATTSSQGQPVIKPNAHSQHTLLKPIQKPDQIQPPRPAQKLQIVSSGASSTVAAAQSAQTIAPAQKRRIDSKTMHTLIAQGAENTTGPWLCLRCGVNGRPISIPSYRGFRRHLINTHKETIDAALCEHCGWRSNSNRELHFHTQVEHKIQTTLYTFPDCLMCAEVLIDTNALNQHMMESHPNENQQQCIYCNKIFAKEIQLYTHTKIYHKKQAIDDGIIDYSDNDGEDEAMDTQVEEAAADVQGKQPSLSSANNSMDKKIKILSDISLPSAGSLIKLEQSSEAAALTTIASGIAASIGLETSEEFISTSSETAISGEVANAAVSDGGGGEPKFVSADGNEMVLTEEQRKEIMSQLNQEHDGGVVMVINEATFSETAEAADTNETSQDGQTEEPVETVPTEDISEEHAENDEDGYDDNSIYKELSDKAGEEAKKESSGLEESKGSIDNLEWAENLITAHELEEESNSKINVEDKLQGNEKDIKKDEDISNKLKELTGDWTDDEIDDEEEEREEAVAKPIAEIATNKQSDEAVESVGATESILDKLTSEVVQGETEEEIPKEERDEEDSGNVKETKNHPISEETEDDIDVALKSLHEEKEGKVDADELAGNLIVENATKIEESGSISKVNNRLVEFKDGGGEMDVDIENVAKDDVKSDAIVLCEKSDAIVEGKNSLVLKNMDEEATEDKDKSDEFIKNDPTKFVDTLKSELLEKLLEAEDNTKDSKPEDTDSDKEMETAVPNEPETTEADQEVKADTTDNADVKNEQLEKDCNTTSIADKPSTTTNTEDKVRTLISEWGDDEDDDEIQELGSLI